MVSSGMLKMYFIYFSITFRIQSEMLKHRTMVKLIAIIVIISFTSRLIGGITFNYLSNTDNPATMFYWNALFGVILSAIYGTATYFILKLKLNLE